LIRSLLSYDTLKVKPVSNPANFKFRSAIFQSLDLDVWTKLANILTYQIISQSKGIR